MARLRISDDARSDLDGIWLNIAADNVEAADRLIDSVLEDYRRLTRHPYLGRVRKDLRPELRSWGVGSYVIFYTATDDCVEIVRVLHGAQDLPSLFV